MPELDYTSKTPAQLSQWVNRVRAMGNGWNATYDEDVRQWSFIWNVYLGGTKYTLLFTLSPLFIEDEDTDWVGRATVQLKFPARKKVQAQTVWLGHKINEKLPTSLSNFLTVTLKTKEHLRQEYLKIFSKKWEELFDVLSNYTPNVEDMPDIERYDEAVIQEMMGLSQIMRNNDPPPPPPTFVEGERPSKVSVEAIVSGIKWALSFPNSIKNSDYGANISFSDGASMAFWRYKNDNVVVSFGFYPPRSTKTQYAATGLICPSSQDFESLVGAVINSYPHNSDSVRLFSLKCLRKGTPPYKQVHEEMSRFYDKLMAIFFPAPQMEDMPEIDRYDESLIIERELGEVKYTAPYKAYKSCTRSFKRKPDLEPLIATEPRAAYMYAACVIRGRWPEAEPTILTSPQHAEAYAQGVLHHRWPEAEPMLLKHPNEGIRYAEFVIKKRWPALERVLLKKAKSEYNSENPHTGTAYELLSYAINVMHDRWPEAEPYLARVGGYMAKKYAENIFGIPEEKADEMVKSPEFAAKGFSIFEVPSMEDMPEIDRYDEAKTWEWEEMGLLLEGTLRISDILGLLIENGEKIVAAAVEMPDGEIFTGHNHIEAFEKAEEAGYHIRWEDSERYCGFLTSSGNFVSRKVAFKIAQKSKQTGNEPEYKRGMDDLVSELTSGI